MARVTQNNFNGGELAPLLWERTDLEKYAAGLRYCRNCYVLPQGAVTARPGTQFVAEVGDSTKTVRLIPFRFNTEQNYVLLFQPLTMRVVANGAYVVYPATIAPILAATKAVKCKITVESHPFQNGDLARISGVGGMTQLNGNDYTVGDVTTKAVDILFITQANPARVTVLQNAIAAGDIVRVTDVAGMTQVNDRNFSAANVVAKTAEITDITRAANGVVTTSAAHGLTTGERARLTNVGGMGQVNEKVFSITFLSATTFQLNADTSTYDAYVSGGNVRSYSFELAGENSTGHTAYGSDGLATNRTFTLNVNSTGFGTYTNGGQAQYAPSWLGQPVQIATPWAEADLPYLSPAQSADVVTIARKGLRTRELTRHDHHLWAITDFTVGQKIGTPAFVTVTAPQAGSYDHKYQVTAVDDETGEESLPQDGQVLNKELRKDANPATVTFGLVPGASRYYVYYRRASGGTYGFVGICDNINTLTNVGTFQDDGITAAMGETPPKARDPFAEGEHPGTVTYHQQRILFGNFPANPQAMAGSQIGIRNNFGVSTPIRADDGIAIALSSREVNEIRHMLSIQDLVVFTAGAVWRLASAEGEVISAVTPPRTDPQVAIGSSWVRPLLVGNSVLYIEELGGAVRELFFQLAEAKFIGNDLTVFAPHLFEGHSLVDWDFALKPDSIAWAVRSDGKGLALTYQREHQVWAWSLCDTPGDFERICVVPEGLEHAVYFIVRRKIGGTWKRYIERLHTRLFADVRDCFFVDSGLSLDLPLVITGATQASPVVLTVVAHGLSNGDLVDAADVEGMTQLNLKRFKVAGAAANTFQLTNPDDDTPIDGTAYGAYESGGVVRKAVTTMSGLGHLEGRTVTGLADGNEITPAVVTGGAIALSEPASRVHIGLAYTPEVELLKPDVSRVRGGAQAKSRRISEATLHLVNSRGIWVGANRARMREGKWRTTEAGGEPTRLRTGWIDISPDPEWNRDGTVILQQRSPLPMTLTAVVTEVHVDD